MRNISKEMSQTLDERTVSKIKCNFLILFVIVALSALLYPPLVSATPILGTATNFAVLGSTGVSNTGPTVVFGGGGAVANLGNWQNPGANAISGFSTAGNTFFGPGSFTDGPGLVNAPAAIYGGEGVAQQARDDFWTADLALAGLPFTSNLSGADLGNYNTGNLGALAPGVYKFNTSVGVTGTLELDAGGINGVYWVFQIGSTLNVAASSVVKLINPGSNNGSDDGVFWVVGSSATLLGSSAFEGNILAADSISMLDSATIYNGRAFAYTGAVSLINNTISDICPNASETEAALNTAIANEITYGITPQTTVAAGHGGSSSPNSGPGFSGGLEFVNGELVPIGGGPTPTPVPEPSTMFLLGGGLLGLVAFRKKFRK